MEIKVKFQLGQEEEERLQLEQMNADPNVWKITKKREEGGEGVFKQEPTLRGAILVYVDDLMILGSAPVVKACIDRIAEEWEVAPPRVA